MTFNRFPQASVKLPPGLVLSAPASGAGKTTLTLGLTRALSRRGHVVQAFKSGPDYIDPTFHARATERASFNLDTWSMPESMLAGILAAASRADIAIVEGAMGLFDGAALKGAFGTGASADLAALTGWPVILVMDCTGQAQTAAAVASGLSYFRPDVRVGGVILNKLSSERHYDLVRRGFEGTGLEVLGWMPRNISTMLPQRHLGLVQAGETEELDILLGRLADLIEARFDLDRLLALMRRGSNGLVASPYTRSSLGLSPPGMRIALARDAAFSFFYPHMLEAWRRQGAAILPFSPLADEAPDTSADVCWLPGGYPELHAGRISAARTFIQGLRTFARTKPVHGECGGYMVLGEALIDSAGMPHEMTGLLGLVTSFETRRLHLGYREAHLREPMPGYRPGTRLRGHEFHYSTVISVADAPLAGVRDASGAAVAERGSRRGLVTGTFFHLVADVNEDTA